MKPYPLQLYQFHQQGVQAFSVQGVTLGQQGVHVGPAPTDAAEPNRLGVEKVSKSLVIEG
jgi:hypothetical protein